MSEKQPTFPSYLGQWVFVERETGDTYLNGEYFVVQQTPCVLYCAKLAGVYGGHELKKFNLIGKDPYKVVSAYIDDQAAGIGIDSMKHWAGAVERREKLQWVEYVYTECGVNARMAERAIQERAGKMCVGAASAPRKPIAVWTVYSDGSMTLVPAS